MNRKSGVIALTLAVLIGATVAGCSRASHDATSPSSPADTPAAPTPVPVPPSASSVPEVGGMDVRYLDDDDTVKTLKVRDFKR